MDLMPASYLHWHLLLNHFPSIGVALALALLFSGLYKRSEDLTRASLVLFAIIGLLTIPTYVTGAAARGAIEGTGDVSSAAIQAHQDAATYGFIALLITGWLAWLALWQYRRFGKPSGWVVPGVFVLGLLSFATMFRTGRLGGYINHPEIVPSEVRADAASSWTADLAARIIDGAILWPTLEALHFMGMAVLFGVVLLVSIRVLGVARSVPFSAFHRLLPLGVFGFVINVVTGMLFFVADWGRYITMTNSFFPKMALIVIGGVAVLYFTIFDRPWSLKPGDDAPLHTKAVAVATVLMWAGVLIYGRLLPYLEGAGG
jgi:hypothetical protein